MPLDESPGAGEFGHLADHAALHERYNDSVPILSGTTAARPTGAAAGVGAFYWDTDTEILYRSDGTNWDAVATGAAAAHVLVSATHTASGLTAGHVLRATAATTFGFGAIQDGDLPATIARDSEVTTAVSDHAASADPHPGYVTTAEGSTLISDHVGAADPHTGYRLESADHSHQSTGLQGGKIDHGAALDGLADDDHPQYLKEEASGGTADEVPDHTHASGAQAGTVSHAALTSLTTGDPHTQYMLGALLDAKGDIIAATADNTPARLAVGANDTVLTAASGEATGLKWAAAAGSSSWTEVLKTADESVTSSTAQQNDDHLLFTAAANKNYEIDAFLVGTDTAGNGFNFEWVEADGTFHLLYYGISVTSAIAFTACTHATGVATINVAGGNFFVRFTGVLRAGGAGGTFRLKWAQSFSSGTSVTLLNGSSLRYRLLN